MTREERENALHCLKVMIDEEVCEECNLYGTTGTDHCEADCVRVAVKALEQEPTTKNDLGVDLISREQAKAAIRDKFKDLPSRVEINTILNELPSVTPQEPILDKIFCITHPLSIMSTPELEHKAIMQIAEMLEPLCLLESEDK